MCNGHVLRPSLIFNFMPATSRIISTLCPKRLQPSDCVDISSRSWATVKLQCGASHVRYNESNWNATGPFPPNTRGFFYYHTPPKAPPLIGEIRFRCANTLDDFHNGEDLLSKDKFQTPWSIPLYTLANYAYYAKWGEQLVLDNLVTQATLDKWVISAKRNVRRDRPVLYYLTQPFFFRFNSHTIAFYAVTKDGISSYTPNNPMKDKRLRYNIPYRGEQWSWFRTDIKLMIFFAQEVG